jgi:hypothetical protein
MYGVQGVAGSNPAVPITQLHCSRALCSEAISAQRRDSLGHMAFCCAGRSATIRDALVNDLAAVRGEHAELAARWLEHSPSMLDDELVNRTTRAFACGASSPGLARETERVLRARADWPAIEAHLCAPLNRPRAVSIVEAAMHLARIAAEIDTSRKHNDRARLQSEFGAPG